MPNRPTKDRILILTPTGRDSVATAELLGRSGLEPAICPDVAHLTGALGDGAGAVLIAEEALMLTGVQMLEEWIQNQPPWSDLPIVLLSSRHDTPQHRHWREDVTSRFKNVTILERPVHGLTLVSSLRVALRSRARQYEVRAHLDIQARAAEQLERLVHERTAELQAVNTELNRQIAERERMAAQLRHAQKMEAIGQLTGGLAHDFNNMLAVIIGALNLLERRLKNIEPSTKRYIDGAQEGAQRAAQLTQRLLAFSRQQALNPRPIEIHKLVNGMSELLHGAVGRDVILETVGGAELWQVNADPNQLENAILNIALNARDAMPDGGKLTIEMQNFSCDERHASANPGIPAGQYLLISITDTGAGMPASIAEKAFDPFFTTKGVGKGTGLGLSQVYGFVTQSGGYVKIQSEVGKGTSIKIYLPRHHPDSVNVQEENTQAQMAMEGHQELVLVVDDEEKVRQLAVDVLRELGYRVLEAPDGESALGVLKEHPNIDLLFTDIVMPGMNGRKLADEALRTNDRLKVLFTTGYNRNAVVHNGVLDAGINLIGKPYTFEELAGTIRDVLDAPTPTARMA